MSKSPENFPAIDEKKFNEQVMDEIEFGFKVLKEFQDNKRTSANQEATTAVGRLLENLEIMNLKQKDYEEHGLNITKEKLKFMIKEYQKTEMED